MCIRDRDEDGLLDPFNLEDVIETDSLYPANGRGQQRTIFPADYLWSTQRVDNLRQVMLSEVRHFESVDQRTTESRRGEILSQNGLGRGCPGLRKQLHILSWRRRRGIAQRAGLEGKSTQYDR